MDETQKAEPESVTEERVQNQTLVPVTRAVVLSPEHGKQIDQQTIAFKYYNSFNYPFLSKENRDVYLTMGITSPSPGEGKTLVASNLAVSLALGYQKRTVVIDLNLRKPRLHEIFGAPL